MEPEPEQMNSPRKVETDIVEPQKAVAEKTRNPPVAQMVLLMNDDPYNLLSGATLESWPSSSK